MMPNTLATWYKKSDEKVKLAFIWSQFESQFCNLLDIDKEMQLDNYFDALRLEIKELPYARDKTAVDLFHFLLFCLWSIREASLFKKVVYLVNLPASHLTDELDNNEILFNDV